MCTLGFMVPLQSPTLCVSCSHSWNKSSIDEQDYTLVTSHCCNFTLHKAALEDNSEVTEGPQCNGSCSTAGATLIAGMVSGTCLGPGDYL